MSRGIPFDQSMLAAPTTCGYPNFLRPKQQVLGNGFSHGVSLVLFLPGLENASSGIRKEEGNWGSPVLELLVDSLAISTFVFCS